MKTFTELTLCFLLASGAFGQFRGGMGGRGGFAGHGGFGGRGFVGGFGHGGFGGGFGHGFVGGSGFGSRFRGVPFAPGFFPGSFGFGSRFRGFGFREPFFFDRFAFHRSTLFEPFASTIFVGGVAPLVDYPVYPYESQPNVTVIYPYTQEPAPSVVVTQTAPARPVMREYNRPEDYGQPPAKSSSIIYLIAFKDHVIRAALAYWVDGQTLHYLDLDHVERRASLDSVDRDLSAELNRERRVPFRLPQ